VLTVGASNHRGTNRRGDDTIGPFSSRGPSWIDFAAKPDIVSPGVGIESLAEPWTTLYGRYSAYLLPGSDPWFARRRRHRRIDARGKPEPLAERDQGDPAVHRAGR
jgi:hypothetical protein